MCWTQAFYLRPLCFFWKPGCQPLCVHVLSSVCCCVWKGLGRSHWVNAWPCLTDWVSNSRQLKLFQPQSLFIHPYRPLWCRHLKAPLTHPGGRAWHTEDARDVSARVHVRVRARAGYVWECVRVCSCTLVCTYVHARRLCLAPRWLTIFFFLLTFIFLDFTPLVPLYVHLLQHLSCSLCFGVRCFNKLSHILNSSRTFLHLIFFFFLKALPSQSKSKPVLSFSRLLSRYTVPCVFSVNKPLICSPTLYFSDCLIYDGLGMCLAAGHFNYRSRSLSLE